MIVLWLILSVLALITIWFLPTLARITARRVTKWVESGQNQRFRHYCVQISISRFFLVVSSLAWIASRGREQEAHTPFESLSNDLFGFLFYVSIFLTIVFFCMQINNIVKLISAYREPVLEILDK